MLRSTLRVARVATRAASVARPRLAARVFAVAAISTAAVATTGTTTTTGAGSVAATNTRSRSVAHVSSPATASTGTTSVAKKTHWSADGEGINAEQRALAKVQSSDPIVRLAAATTRELLQQACQAPGVVDATLTKEVMADSVAAGDTVAEEQQFLAKMESEFGRDVLQVLRRQQWSVNLAGGNATTSSDHAATLVCYFQEGTQRILYRRLSQA